MDNKFSIFQKSRREIGRVKRNWQPIVSPLWSFFRAKDEAAREEGLRELVNWIQRKRIDPWRNEGFEALKGFPQKYLESHPKVREHLDATHHLGMLEELGFAQVSRLDYTLLQARNLLALKKAHPNLGLSSPVLKVAGISLTGLELAQLWAILHNSGHLFGTFATERGFLFCINERADLQEQLLSATDERLRAHVREILAKSQIYKCAQAVAAWTASQEVESEVREVCVAALLAYIHASKDSRHDKVKWVFKRVRQFSYLQLHGSLGIGMQQGFSIPDEPPDDLIGHPSFTFEAHAREEGDLILLLDSINEFQHRSFFTSPAASLAVLRHLREFKHWWTGCDRKVLSANDRLVELFSRPTNWQRVESDGLVHVCRLELEGTGDDWRQEVKSWYADGTPWGSSNFLISHIPGMSGLLCDVFSHSITLPSEVTAQVFSQLALHSERSWEGAPTGAAKRLWRSVGAFGISLLNQALIEGKRAVLAPAAATVMRSWAERQREYLSVSTISST